MKIAHIALWTRQLEQQARFWVSFFDGEINEKYCSQTNPGFESFFVKIGDNIAIELMTKPGLAALTADNNHTGWVHLAISVAARKMSTGWRNAPTPREYWFPRREPPVTATTKRCSKTPMAT